MNKKEFFDIVKGCAVYVMLFVSVLGIAFPLGLIEEHYGELMSMKWFLFFVLSYVSWYIIGKKEGTKEIN